MPPLADSLIADPPAASTLDEGVDRKRLRQIKQRFMGVNQARLQRARTGLDARQLIFLDVLPLLFHSNHPMLPGYVSHQTPHGVSDYTPSKTDITRAQRIARSFNFAREPHMRRRIHSLYLMGSCGTVAQSERSDFDIWVCHAAELDAAEQQLLRRKCDEISRWATTLRLEVHFFLMEGEKFRLGEREGVSTEDCGSSQHYLLLDEFYRTGLLLAGRAPIWWLIPPDEEAQHDFYAETLRHKRFVKNTDTVDFGGVAQIPAGEFVGAGVWQLTKAIDSPYKSVIKLLLTEVYASEYPRVEPLSSTFKRAIYNNQLDIDELDPYVMMYRKLERYLLARDEPKRLELVRRCFYFKVGKAISKGPGRRVKSWQRLLLEKMTAQWRWSHQHLLNMDARPQWKVTRVLDEQKELVRELNNSYRFLLEFARRSQASTIINGRDMTVLGRKLYAAFERKAGKVEWVNPGIAPNLAEEVLTFCQLPSGRDRQLAWAVFAETPRALGHGKDVGVRPLRRTADLMALLAWCHVNGLLDWNTQLHVIEGEHQVTEFELQNIVRVLRAQLPVHAGAASRRSVAGGHEDEQAQERFLSANRPQAMVLFINVGIDPMAQMRARGLELLSSQTDSLRYSGLRENLVLGVDVIVLNSWGEVTTRAYQGAFALLQCLRDYLLMLPPHQHPGLPTLQIQSFCPTRAAAIAQRVEQLFQDIIACYYSGTRPAGARYVLEMQREFYVLQWLDGQPSLQRAPGYTALLELLGRVQRSYSPIVFDRHCLPDSLLAHAVLASRPERVQVFYQRHANSRDSVGSSETAEVLVLDEMGSVYAFTTPFRDEATLLQPLDQFLQSVWLRQRSEIALDESERDGNPLVVTIDYFELVGERNALHIERRTPMMAGGGASFNVQAIADYDQSGNPSFTIYCDQQEFSELEYGDTLFDTVARHILQHRHTQQRYPCYFTDIDLSRSINDGGSIQTIHYLRYKQRLEKSLNDA
ncbi:MAG: class I adenylate cyclase, partial [Spongiibacteraceae bacterium]